MVYRCSSNNGRQSSLHSSFTPNWLILLLQVKTQHPQTVHGILVTILLSLLHLIKHMLTSSPNPQSSVQNQPLVHFYHIAKRRPFWTPSWMLNPDFRQDRAIFTEQIRHQKATSWPRRERPKRESTRLGYQIWTNFFGVRLV